MFQLHSLAYWSSFESVWRFVICSTLSSVSGVLFDIGDWWRVLVCWSFHFCSLCWFLFGVSFLGGTLFKWLTLGNLLSMPELTSLFIWLPFVVLDLLGWSSGSFWPLRHLFLFVLLMRGCQPAGGWTVGACSHGSGVYFTVSVCRSLGFSFPNCWQQEKTHDMTMLQVRKALGCCWEMQFIALLFQSWEY